MSGQQKNKEGQIRGERVKEIHPTSNDSENFGWARLGSAGPKSPEAEKKKRRNFA